MKSNFFHLFRFATRLSDEYRAMTIGTWSRMHGLLANLKALAIRKEIKRQAGAMPLHLI